MADQNIYTNITATANFTSLTAQLRAVTAELIKLQATTIGLDRNLSNEVGRMNRAFADTMRATGQFSSHFVTLESDVQKFGKRLDTGRMKLGEYYGVWQGHAKKTSTLIKDLAKQQVLMEQAVLQPLGRNAQGQMQYNVHVANGLDVLKNRTALLRQESAILNKVMLDGSNQLINWGKNTQWAGRQLTVGLTVPMIAFGAAAQKAFLEADQQLVRLTKVYGGLGDTSAAELKQVREDVAKTAKELASVYGASYKDTIALAADIAATGKTGNDLLVSTQETTRLAILGEVDRQDAMKATLAIQNAFKQSNEELSQSINFLNAVENQTSTSLADLIEAIPKAGPVIESLGGDVQDLALYLTAMKEGGVNASEGANAIKSSLASLINPTKVAKDMFRGFGIDLEGIVTRNAGDVTGTILELQGALDKLDPLKKSKAIEQLFGKFQFARMNALFANLGKQGSQTLQVLDLMKASSEDLANVASRELKQMTESASGQYKRALESIKADLAGVGDQFLKISTFVLKTIDGIVKFVDKLPAPIKSLLTFLGGLTAFAGPLIMLTGVLGNFLGYIIKGVFHLKQLFKGGAGFKLLTPEMMAAAEAGRVVEKSFFSDAQAAIALETAVNNLAASFDRLKTSALNSAVATSSSISTMGGSTILSPAGTAANADRMADKNSPYIGSPYSRQFAHTIPSATEQPGTIFGVVPNPGPVNVRVGKNPQMYMDDDLPRVPGVTSISGVSTGIVAGEAAKWHAMTAAIATQSQAELSLLKTEVAATGTVTHELSSVYQAMLPQMQQLTQLAADEGRMIVQQLQQGVITVDQARAKIISLNATIEVMMAETAAQVAAGMGRGINLTTVPFTSQPVVDPVTGKSNMKEMFHKPETAALVDDVARGLGVRTSGGGYSIETTKPRIILPKRGPIRGFNDGGYVYTLNDGPVVPGDKNINYDNTMARIPEGGFVLNQQATRNNPQLVDYAKRSKPYNRGGMIDAMLTPYETVFTPEQTQEMLPILEAANNGSRIQFRNAGGMLGGPIVSGKHNYGRFDALKSLFRRKKTAAVDELAEMSSIMKLGKKVKTSGEDAHKFVDEALGAAAPRTRKLANPDGYFFVGNWGLNTRKTTNSKINAGAAKPQEIIDDILSLPAAEALPALRRFLKVNKIDDNLADTLVLEARDKVVANLAAHGESLIGERLFAKSQHSVYLEIADKLGLRKKYIDSLNVPGQRRAFRPAGDTKSGFKAATDITPYSVTDIDELMAKNAEFGTDFMGSYGTYNPKGLKVNGEDGAFAHMQLDEFAMGGIIGKNKRNYGRLFLGMPRSIKSVVEQRKLREAMEQTTAAVSASKFKDHDPEDFGTMVAPSSGRSFPVPGIGGVYKKPDGTKVFVKPVLDEKAALAEQRATQIAREAHGLKAPEQDIKVMRDPTDPTGRRKVLVLESKFDDAFAIKDAKFSEDDYFKQLVASALRGDKDLSRDNLSGSILADVGPAGVFKAASGLRDYADLMPSMAEQARVNLLGVKGGAKRFFAESTIDIPKGMTPEQYHRRMLMEIDDVLPRLKGTISKFDLNDEEQAIYAAMVKRLEDAREVNWKEFHGIHSAVKPTAAKTLTPAALAKIEEAEALKRRQKGHAASLSDMSFKSDANGFNGGGLVNIIKSLAMRRIGAGFGKDTKGGWGVTSLEIGMAEKLFGTTGLTKRTQRILYDKFAEALAKEMPYGYTKNAQGHLIKALEPDIMDSVLRSAASSTISAPEGRRVLSAIDRDILKKKYTNWESRKDTPLTKTLQELIFKLEGREKGGPVSGGTPYIVGEKGPELFVPMNNGGIIPNNALGGMIRTGKYNYGALGPVASVVAQQALPLAAFMLLPKALEKMGIASENSNKILNAIFLAITAKQIYSGVKMAKAAKAAKAATGVADDVAETAIATKSVSKFTNSLTKLRLVGMAIPGWGKVAIVALTTLAAVSYGAWENARKARLASQEAFDVNEKQAKQLGIAYVSLSDKIKKATEAAQKNSQLTKLKAAGSTAIGGGINMSVKELNALQKKAKETQGDIVEMFNNLDENDVTKAATALKVQLVAAGKSAQDAAREIYSIISVSNKAAQATEAVSSTEFLKIVDRASAARVAIETFVKSMNFGDVDKKEIASSFSGGLDAIQLYYQSLVGVKDASGKAKTQVEALNDTIAHMNANKANQQEIGEDILNTLIKENPLYQDILNKNDSMVDAWAKIQLYTNGVTADLSNISGKEAQGLLQVVNAISQAASEMTTNGNLMHNPLDAIADYGVAAKKAYDEAKKASDDATKNAQKNADAEIKALDKKIEKINEEADARIRAIEDQADKQDYLTEVQKEQLNYQQALLAGDMSRAAQSQLNIQGLTNERQKNIAIDAINDKRNADVKKLEEQKVGIQERLVKLQEKANKLQEAANVAQKEYAAVQALQQSIATTLSKASITTDEASLPILAEALRSDVAALAALGKGGAAAAKSVTGDVPVTKGTTITTPGGQQIVQPGKQDWVTYLKSLTNNPGGPADSTIEYAKTYFEKFGTHVEDFGLYVKTLTGLDVVGGTRIIPTSKLRGEVKTNSDPRKTEYFAADGTSLGKGIEGRAKYYDNPGKPMSGEAYIYPNSNVNRGALNGVQDINLALYNKGIKTPLVQDGLKYEHNGSVTKGGKVVGYWGYNIPNVGFKSYATGGSVKNFDGGGNVSGPGTATSDSIPAMLSNGEYVIKASAVDQYGKTFFDGLNAQKFATGGPAYPSWKKPKSPYNSKNQPTGSPYGRYWGELERLYQQSPIGFDKNGKPIFNNAGKDPWGGVEIPGLPFKGKVGQFSDYWHQLAEQLRKSSGPGMGIDKDPMRYAGSGASMGGIGNGAYGFGPLMFHKGGLVGHKHRQFASPDGKEIIPQGKDKASMLKKLIPSLALGGFGILPHIKSLAGAYKQRNAAGELFPTSSGSPIYVIVSDPAKDLNQRDKNYRPLINAMQMLSNETGLKFIPLSSKDQMPSNNDQYIHAKFKNNNESGASAGSDSDYLLRPDGTGYNTKEPFNSLGRINLPQNNWKNSTPLTKNLYRDLMVHELIHLLSTETNRTNLKGEGVDREHAQLQDPLTLEQFNIMQNGVSGYNSYISRDDILSIRKRFNLDNPQIDISKWGSLNLDKKGGFMGEGVKKANGGLINAKKFHKGGPVGHKHLPAGHMASNYKAPYSGPSMSALSPAKAAANSKATDKFYEKNGNYSKNENGEWVKNPPSLWETFTTGKNWTAAIGGNNPGGPIHTEMQNILLSALVGSGGAKRYQDGSDWAKGEYLTAAVNIALARVGGVQGNALMRSILEGFGAAKGIPNLGHILQKGSFPFLGAAGSKFVTNAATAAVIGGAKPFVENKIANTLTAAQRPPSISQQVARPGVSDEMQKTLTQSLSAGEASRMAIQNQINLATSIAKSEGRFAPSLIGTGSVATITDNPRYLFQELLDGNVDDIMKWPWRPSIKTDTADPYARQKPMWWESLYTQAPVETLSYKQKKMIAMLAGIKVPIGKPFPKITQTQMDSGSDAFYKNEELLKKWGGWSDYRDAMLKSVGLDRPMPEKSRFVPYSEAAALKASLEDVKLKNLDGTDSFAFKYTIGGAEADPRWSTAFGSKTSVIHGGAGDRGALMLDGDLGAAMRSQYAIVYEDLIKTGFIRRARIDKNGKRIEQKDLAPLPTADRYYRAAMTLDEFLLHVSSQLPGVTTSSRLMTGTKEELVTRPSPFIQALNESYVKNVLGMGVEDSFRFTKYDIHGSPLVDAFGNPKAGGYYSLDEGFDYATNPGSRNYGTPPSPGSRLTKGKFTIDLLPREFPSPVFAGGGFTDEMAIVVPEWLAIAKSKHVAKLDPKHFTKPMSADYGRYLHASRFFKPTKGWTVTDAQAAEGQMFGIQKDQFSILADLLNTGKVKTSVVNDSRFGAEKAAKEVTPWTEDDLWKIVTGYNKNAIIKEGNTRRINPDWLQSMSGNSYSSLEQMLKVEELVNLMRIHIQNLPPISMVEPKVAVKPKVSVNVGRPRMAEGGYVNPTYSANMSIPKFETGINNVPADMLAMLHKNEAVVPANMNPFNPNANNATMGGGVYNITNNINGADCDINELSDIVTRKTIESMKTISTLNMKTVGQNRSLGSSLEVRA